MNLLSLNPNVSVDCVVFGFENEQLNVLLIEKKMRLQSRVQFALPGDLISDNESLSEAAERVLVELTGLTGIYLKQFKAFGNTDRVKDVKDLDWLRSNREHPNARVITVVYFALVKMEDYHASASSFADGVLWQNVQNVPSLAFDHDQIFAETFGRLREEFEWHKSGFELLPEKFTLSQIQSLYEIILGKKLDKRNFRKKILKENLVTPTNEKQQGVLHKPAMLYEINVEEDK